MIVSKMVQTKKHIYANWLMIIMVSLASLISCSSKDYNAQELLQWINTPEHGLIKTRTINGFDLSTKYLPPHYLAYKESKEAGVHAYDSLLNHYSKFRTFLLTISPDDEHEQSDVMFYNVINKADHKKRVRELNFNVNSFISITTNKGELFPVLHTLENTYELAKHKTIYLVFADNEYTDDLLTSEKLDLKFSDELFDTGISHFVFEKRNLENIPELNIEQ